MKLPAPTLEALSRIAKQDNISIEQVLRDAVNRDLDRREEVKKPVRIDKRHISPLRALLADDFAFSKNWKELQSRLSSKGYILREAGEGLHLHKKNGDRICESSELGYGYASLMRRFQHPFSCHNRIWMSDRMLG